MSNKSKGLDLLSMIFYKLELKNNNNLISNKNRKKKILNTKKE